MVYTNVENLYVRQPASVQSHSGHGEVSMGKESGFSNLPTKKNSLQRFLEQCKLTFKRCGWRLSCSESVNFRKLSLSGIIICLDFKIVRSGFTESLHLVGMTRTAINSNKPGKQNKTTYTNQNYSVTTNLCINIVSQLGEYFSI